MKIDGQPVLEVSSNHFWARNPFYDQFLQLTLSRYAADRSIIRHFVNNRDAMDDYLVNEYTNQYQNEDNLYRKFTLQSAYIINYEHGVFRPPSKYLPPQGFTSYIPYNFNNLHQYYKNNVPSIPMASLVSFEKAKALVAIDGYGNQVKQIINGSSA